MPLSFADTLVVGISTRALFDLEAENKLFQEQGIVEYRKYQKDREGIILEKGTGFYLVNALLNLNSLAPQGTRLVEVIVMSRNSPETGIRVLNSIKYYGLDITRSAFTGGESLYDYIEAFDVDLFLSKDEVDVQKIIDSGIAAAALIYEPPQGFIPETTTVRIAFDADAVVFSDDSEQIYKAEGIEAFHENESTNSIVPLNEGPYAKLLKTLSKIQRKMETGVELSPLRIAIVTARNSPSHMRVLNTLREWDVYVDEAFFLGGLSKDKVLKAFKAHIFFDDQDTHLIPAKSVVPSAKVPYRSTSPLFVKNDELTIIDPEVLNKREIKKISSSSK
ncbi:5'-nucleotidase [Mucilaginibacter robiniae]|uniref:5'-nucleotidase n=1 Tax=Mucilaginibacter robiniae TaxID=2728022 RepID=A0A7L5E4P6_9SPHI|nr:5'-nucleotidase [Mucilaginibacter robiniae]QJD95803.1 5'-nucleotidase [Mucilaginibacter robiniae]